MNKEVSNESFNDSITLQNNKNIKLELKEESINIQNEGNNNNCNNRVDIIEKNKIQNKQDYSEDLNKNYNQSYNKKFLKKINNEKVNNTLNDIYGAISNINEINEKMKNFLLKRQIIHKSSDIKTKMINNEKSKKIRVRPSTDEKRIYSKKFSKEKKGKEIDKHIYKLNNTNNMELNTAKNISSYNIKSINGGCISKNDTLRNNSKNDTNHHNKSYNNNSNFAKKISDKYIEPINKKHDQKNFKNINNIKLNNYYFKLNENIGNNYSIESVLKSNDISHIDISSYYYNEEIKNEKDIKNIRIKLINEEKKLQNLEEEKHKLLKEEKIRRKLIMEKIQTRNKMKKQNALKEYKKKLSIIKILQEQNMNEIVELEKKKEIDVGKLKQINNLINEEDINKKLLKLRKSNRKKKNIRENQLNDIGNDIYENTKENKKNQNKFFTFSKEDINDFSNIEKNLIKEYKYNNSKDKYLNNIEGDDFKKERNFTPKYLNKNLEDHNKIKTDKTRHNINNRKLSFEEFINYQNNKKNYIYNNYNSESRKYEKKYMKNNFNYIPSYIKARANKFNYNNSRRSSSSHFSHKFSVEQIIPYSLNYNFNNKYNYNMPSNRSYSNYYVNKKGKNNSKRNSKNRKEFNYKKMFFNIE